MTKEVSIFDDNKMPAYINQQSTRGSEAVTAEDLTIPRLELVQSTSPCRKKKDAAYIEGAEEGLLYNNVSRELYGGSVFVVPVIFAKQWLIWKDRDAGGGFRGAFDDKESAAVRVQELIDEGDNGPFDIVDTAQNLCLLLKVDDKGKVTGYEEIAISMAKSKMKVSRQWNSIIRMMGGDRFSRVYQISAVEETNDRNEAYYNYHVSAMGFPPEEVYKAAESLFNDMQSGSKDFNVNQDHDEPSTDKTGEKPEF